MTEKVPFEYMAFDPRRAAEVLNISQSRVFELLASGDLHSHKIGRRRCITGADILDFRARCRM